MKKVLFSFLCFCLTSTLWAQAIDCKQDFNCFIQAASKCAQAQIIIEGSFETPDLVYKVKRQALIQGYNGTKCLYDDLVQNLEADIPSSQKANLQKQGWTEAIIKGQALSLARNLDLQKGLVRECEFSSTELVSILQQHFQENKLDKEKWDTCKRRTIETQTIPQASSRQDEKVAEDEQEDDEDEDEEVDTEVPALLSYPYNFNALDYLQNSMAEISPFLGKKKTRLVGKASQAYSKTEEIKTEQEQQAQNEEKVPLLIFKSTEGQYVPPTPAPTPIQRYYSPYSAPQKSYKEMSKSERIKIITGKRETPAGKSRLYPQMTQEEMVKAGYSNEEIGEFVFKRINEEKEALAQAQTCTNGCPKGTYCQQVLKRCIQCSGPSDCPSSQICLNYQCVSGETVIKPEKKKAQ